MDGALHNELMTALEWYVDHGVIDVLGDEVIDRTVIPAPDSVSSFTAPAQDTSPPHPQPQGFAEGTVQTATFLGKSDAYEEAVKLARAASNLDELKEAIASFDGIAIKKTATNLVFSDGNPRAGVMIVGEAPGADEDRLGEPFVGTSGQLLDRIMACIGLSREAEDAENALYMSNVLNWRPPGNRTPSPAEIEVSLPFIERHIQLIKPKVLVFCGGVSAKSLLGRSEGISRLRKKVHDYLPQTKEFSESAKKIPALVTYHPSYLLSTPGQKAAVWQDILELQNILK